MNGIQADFEGVKSQGVRVCVEEPRNQSLRIALSATMSEEREDPHSGLWRKMRPLHERKLSSMKEKSLVPVTTSQNQTKQNMKNMTTIGEYTLPGWGFHTGVLESLIADLVLTNKKGLVSKVSIT